MDKSQIKRVSNNIFNNFLSQIQIIYSKTVYITIATRYIYETPNQVVALFV